MALYKYVVAERVDVLRNGLIRYTQPSALNDPFDMSPNVKQEGLDAHMFEKVKQLRERIVRMTDDELLDQVIKMAEERLLSEVAEAPTESAEERAWKQKLSKMSRSEIKQVLKQSIKQAMSPESLTEFRAFFENELTEENVIASIEEALTIVPRIVNKMGALSLTQRPDHQLMWSHYAANHSGMVLIFDENHDFFRAPRKARGRVRYTTDSPMEDLQALRRVKYRSERPTLGMSTTSFDQNHDFSQHFFPSPGKATEDKQTRRWIDQLFYTKSLDWKYEQEWRTLRLLGDASKVIEVPEGNIYLFSLPSSCIQGVIFGQRMTDATKAPIIQFLARDKRYRHVKLFEAKVSTESFRIEICALP